ncbi:hypothetical protein HK104_009740 [Borealophlyctis nickersoniae]|nr:hypothetical protein HK104_009740 [Borealophlyctis nickersoniae]
MDTFLKKTFRYAQSHSGDTVENVFYGPYNSLLIKLFPLEENYTLGAKIAPTGEIDYFVVNKITKARRRDVRVEAGEGVVADEAEEEDIDLHPVFILEVKPSSHYTSNSTRKDADLRVRSRLQNIAHRSQELPVIWAISALGTRFAVYRCERLDNGDLEVTPSPISPDPTDLMDTAPQRWWSWDLMDPTGYAKFVEVSERVMQSVSQICVEN